MTHSKSQQSPSRRDVMLFGAAALLNPGMANAQARNIWSAEVAYQALKAGEAVILDIRTSAEWKETGVAEGAWPVSLAQGGFARRLDIAFDLAGTRTMALICATGGRSGYVQSILRRGGMEGTVDVSEGMLGSRLGPGWIKSGLPIVPLETALRELPAKIRAA